MLAVYSGGIIDGVDGLAGGVFIVMFSAYAVIAYAQNQIDLSAFCSAIAGANLASVYAGITVSATASDAAFHAVNVVFNGASSSINVDGSSTVVNPGAQGFVNNLNLFSLGAGTQQFHGYAAEFGIWAGSFSGAQLTSMNSNQHAYWNF